MTKLRYLVHTTLEQYSLLEECSKQKPQKSFKLNRQTRLLESYLNSSVHNVIELLKDGKWHTVAEIHQETKVHEVKIGILAEFLAAYSFLNLNRKEKRAKLSRIFTEFLKESDKLE